MRSRINNWKAYLGGEGDCAEGDEDIRSRPHLGGRHTERRWFETFLPKAKQERDVGVCSHPGSVAQLP